MSCCGLFATRISICFMMWTVNFYNQRMSHDVVCWLLESGYVSRCGLLATGISVCLMMWTVSYWNQGMSHDVDC